MLPGLACLAATLAYAQETRYVTDTLEATVRTGKGTEYQILRIIQSGTPVKVLESTQDGYTRVELKDGKAGWMLSRYLSETPIARVRLAAAEKQVEQLSAENNRLKGEKQALAQAKIEAEQALTRLGEKRAELNQEVSDLGKLAARPQAVESKNQKLQERIATLETETQRLREENASLQTGDDRGWFLAGAGVLLGGFALGVLVPRIRWRKKSSWDTF